MAKKFKISRDEIAILKQCAAKESSPELRPGQILLDPAIMRNVKDPGRVRSMNVALVSDLPGHPDTDLHEYGKWKDFVSGVDLTEDGSGFFDFYIRRRNDNDGDLYGNVSIKVENGRMAEVTGYSEIGIILWQP